jgi:hypothetical protein
MAKKVRKEWTIEANPDDIATMNVTKENNKIYNKIVTKDKNHRK